MSRIMENAQHVIGWQLKEHPAAHFIRYCSTARTFGGTPQQATRRMILQISRTAIGPLDWPLPVKGQVH